MAGAYQGFCSFRQHPRLINWLGIVSIPSLWLLLYTVVATGMPWGGRFGIGGVSVVASIGSGIYAGLLYIHAIGSPYGNVSLPLIVPGLVPAVVYTHPFDIVINTDFWTWPQLLVPLVSGLAALLAVLQCIQWGYRRLDDPVDWEQRVFPYGFRVVDDTRRSQNPDEPSSGILLRPRTTFRGSFGLNPCGWLFAVVFIAPMLALSLYGNILYDDSAFDGIMTLGVGIVIHFGLRLEGDSGEATDRQGG